MLAALAFANRMSGVSGMTWMDFLSASQASVYKRCERGKQPFTNSSLWNYFTVTVILHIAVSSSSELSYPDSEKLKKEILSLLYYLSG